MKRFAAITTTLLVFSLALPFHIFANENNYVPKAVTLSSDEVVDEDYFAAGDVVEIFGTVNGDAYVAGGQVIIDGTINGDLLAVGGTIIVSGTVTQDIRIVGGDIDITGEVGRNVSFGAGDITFGGSSTIAGSVVGGAGNVLVTSPIGGNMKIGAGNVTISNKVEGDIDAGVDQLRLTSNAEVNGDITYWSQLDAQVDETATVSGTVTKKVGIQNTNRVETNDSQPDFGYWTYWLLSSGLFGALFVYALKPQVLSASNLITKNPWKSLLLGIVTIILTPLFTILAMITVIGIPIGFTSLLVYGLLLYVSKFVAMVCTGNWIMNKLKKKTSAYKSLLVGLLVLAVLKLSPITNVLGTTTFLLMGLGAISLTIKNSIGSRK